MTSAPIWVCASPSTSSGGAEGVAGGATEAAGGGTTEGAGCGTGVLGAGVLGADVAGIRVLGIGVTGPGPRSRPNTDTRRPMSVCSRSFDVARSGA